MSDTGVGVINRIGSLLARRPSRNVIVTLVLTCLVWGVAWYSIASQVGKPFPGFFYNPERVVSSFTPPDFSGWKAGLRPWDEIVAVNGQSWREMPRLVQEAGIGNPLIYTVERGNRQLNIYVPTMEFTREILFSFLPGYIVSSFVFLGIGIFVYLRNPVSKLNRYLLVYLLVWAIGASIVFESYISQNKWMAYLLLPYAITAPVAGWIFFWSFPEDAKRRQFLKRWPVVRVFTILAIVSIISISGLRVLADILDTPALWHALILIDGWPYFIMFGLGSIFMKGGPLIVIALRKTNQLIRQQAIVMLVGLALGLTGWYLFLWAPAAINVAPVARTQWAGIVPAIYPLSIGYAILRYRLLDIRVVVRKGLVYSLLTAILTAAFILLSLLSGYLFQYITGKQSLLAMIIPALLVAFLFQPVHSRIQTFVDRSFFRHDFEVRQALTQFSRSLTTLRSQFEVIQLVRITITGTLGARDATIWLRHNNHYSPAIDSYETEDSIAAEGALVNWLENERQPLYPMADDPALPAKELHKVNAVLAIPLCTGEKLTGIMTLADKRSGESYRSDDLDLLSMLAHSAALALENARLYEERLGIMRQQFIQTAAIQEEERRRIARELHDGVGPSLASLNIRLHTVKKQLERDQNPMASEVEELAEQAQANIHDIRRLIYDLRPAVLDELGLASALEEYAERFQKDQGIVVKLNIADDQSRLPPELETTLFRISQEALANVARHANARRIELTLDNKPAEISLLICDDGQGFDPEKQFGGAHLGLWSMQKRVEQFGGRFSIDSRPGLGASIIIHIPRNNRGEDIYG
jgi:signal transduction histidine kinase